MLTQSRPETAIDALIEHVIGLNHTLSLFLKKYEEDSEAMDLAALHRIQTTLKTATLVEFQDKHQFLVWDQIKKEVKQLELEADEREEAEAIAAYEQQCQDMADYYQEVKGLSLY